LVENTKPKNLYVTRRIWFSTEPPHTACSRLKQQRFLFPTSQMLVGNSVHHSAYLSGYRLVRQFHKARAMQTACSVAVAVSGRHLLWHQCISSTSKFHGRLKVVRNGEDLAFHGGKYGCRKYRGKKSEIIRFASWIPRRHYGWRRHNNLCLSIMPARYPTCKSDNL